MIDPNKRLTPEDALRHPFLALSSFDVCSKRHGIFMEESRSILFWGTAQFVLFLRFEFKASRKESEKPQFWLWD